MLSEILLLCIYQLKKVNSTLSQDFIANLPLLKSTNKYIHITGVGFIGGIGVVISVSDMAAVAFVFCNESMRFKNTLAHSNQTLNYICIR